MSRPGRQKRSKRRVKVLMVLCTLAFGLFLARLVWLQFFMADHYQARAAEARNTSYTVVQPAARGSLLDSNGVVLAEDATVWSLNLVVPAPPGTSYEETLNILQPFTGGEDVETQLAAFCSAVSAGELPVVKQLDRAQLPALYATGLVQSGAVRLIAHGVRRWANGTLLPQMLGTTGPITAEQWQADGYALRRAGVAMDEVIGQAGLEAAYDDLLRGQSGKWKVNVRYGGGITSTEVVQPPQPGCDLVLTIDSGLQVALQTALEQQILTLQATKPAGKGREASAGAAVVVDTATGGILAAASYPGYDLNLYRENYAQLVQESLHPLLNRVCSGLYAPGSAFKPAVATAMLAEGWPPSTTVNCTGAYGFYKGYRPRCLQLSHQGFIDLFTALQHSCNIYFYDVGRRLGVDCFSAMAQRLGLAAPTGVELPEAAGTLTWSDAPNYTNGLTLMAAIGQGNTAVTPLQLASYAATLANNGQRPALHFGKRAVTSSGETVWNFQPRLLEEISGGQALFAPVREGMARMAQTLRVLREAPVICAAKTGSPQLPATMANGTHYVNSVLIGFAPLPNPEIAVAVVLENGGGGSNAAPVLRAVLDTLYGNLP